MAEGLDALCGDLGVSTVIGPTLGGFFSSGHAWRYAFIVLVPLGLLMAFWRRGFCPRSRTTASRRKPRLPRSDCCLLPC